MASNERVAWALSILKRLPSQVPLTGADAVEIVAFYVLGLRDVSDEQLTEAVARAAAECTFLPTPAELRTLAGVNPSHAPPPDVDGILRRLRSMVRYDPRWGETMPSVEHVRGALGDAIAAAYGFIGPSRLEGVVFGGTGVGVDIARREFAQELATAQKSGVPISLPSLAPMLALPSRDSGAIVYDDRPRVGSGGLRRLGSGGEIADALNRAPR